MMNSLRTAINGIVLKIIFGIIVASFVLADVGSYLINNHNNYVIKVNGEKITHDQVEHALANERNYIKHLGNQFPKPTLNKDYIKSLRQHTINRLIDLSLLDQYAKKLGLWISDEQVKNAIFTTKAFQVDGKFDNASYNAIINQMDMNANQYVQALRNHMTIQQLINIVIDTDFMMQSEIDKLAKLIMQQRVVREATINVHTLANKQQVNDNEIKAYYEQNKNSFIIPQQFRVSYVKLDATEMLETVSDNEIQSYYDQNKDQFIQLQRNHYRIIQTKTESEAKVVLEELKNGADFASLAKIKSIDIISSKNGGGIGWLEETTMPEEFKSAGLQDKGQLSSIIRSPVGFLVIQLDDVKPAKIKPLVEVRDDIINKIKRGKALKTYHALHQKAKDAVHRNNKSLECVEQATGIKTINTAWFSRDKLPQELNFPPIADAIFNGSWVGKNSMPDNNLNIITVSSDCTFVIRVAEFKPEDIKQINMVKDQITTLIKLNKAKQQAKINAEKIISELKKGKGDKALKAAGLSFSPAKTLSRTGQDLINQAVFNLSLPAKGRPSYGIASDMQNNIILLALDEVKIGAFLENQKKEIMRAITKNNAQIMFEALLINLRKEAKIQFGDLMI